MTETEGPQELTGQRDRDMCKSPQQGRVELASGPIFTAKTPIRRLKSYCSHFTMQRAGLVLHLRSQMSFFDRTIKLKEGGNESSHGIEEGSSLDQGAFKMDRWR